MPKFKKGVNAIKDVLAQADDKAEFSNEVPILPGLAYLSESIDYLESTAEKQTLNDFIQEYDTDNDDGIEVYSDDKNLGENLTNVLSQVTVGLKPWEYKFLASYASVPSMLCKILPIVELIGQAGSGKSQLLIAISAISRQSIISGQSTGASLKNYINQIRWADPETKSIEKNCLLLIDNLNEDSFKKEEYLGSFLNGYHKKTDRMFISNGKGQNIEFKTFCPKLYTTIWEKTSTELTRRTVTIRTIKTIKLENLLDPDEIYWTPFRNGVRKFWEKEEHWKLFKSLEGSYAQLSKSKHSKEHWTLVKYVLVSGVAIGIWETLQQAIAETSDWLDTALKSRTTLLELIVLKSLEEILGFKQSEWQAMSQSVKIHVAPRHLKNALDTAVSDGLIEKPKLSEIQQILTKLGWAAGQKENQLGYCYKGITK